MLTGPSMQGRGCGYRVRLSFISFSTVIVLSNSEEKLIPMEILSSKPLVRFCPVSGG